MSSCGFSPVSIDLVDSGAATNMDADITESSTIDDYRNVGVQVVIDNTNAVGVYYIQESIDGTNWVSVVFDDGSSSKTVSSGVDVNAIFNIETNAKHLRFFYDRTSGDGICDVTLFLKS